VSKSKFLIQVTRAQRSSALSRNKTRKPLTLKEPMVCHVEQKIAKVAKSSAEVTKSVLRGLCGLLFKQASLSVDF
jgi:hypothetical protein